MTTIFIQWWFIYDMKFIGSFAFRNVGKDYNDAF